jgi:competence protein ComEA
LRLAPHFGAVIPALSRTDRKSLAAATALVVAGTALRLGFGPAPADVGWSPGDGVEPGPVPVALRTAVEEGVAAEARASTPLAPGERVDPNFADAAELRRLPGIGPAKAEAILAERRRGGPYASLEDLRRVPGLGPTTIERLAPHLALTPGLHAGHSAEPLDLNRAGVEALSRLPGIGPVLAGRIVAVRRARGRFRSVDELLDVPGIGPATLENIRTGVRIR